jgi:KipI family sensor histidine kinase inhibitor
MDLEYPRFAWCGDGCLFVEFGDGIDLTINSMVRALGRDIHSLAPGWLVETVPTYRSLAIYIDPWESPREEVEELARSICQSLEPGPVRAGPVLEIPVCYGGEFGPDMKRVSEHTGLSPEDVIAIHSGSCYHVFMMGFTPGFPYLGGMDRRLETPRLPNPRTVIPEGSVGIAGKQTGIYPITSPGGWNLVGRTPLRLFDQEREAPFLLEAGMNIVFVPISAETFETILSERGSTGL